MDGLGGGLLRKIWRRGCPRLARRGDSDREIDSDRGERRGGVWSCFGVMVRR